MVPLPTLFLDLPMDGPPIGYSWEGSDISDVSTSTAFEDKIGQRDRFLGRRRCVICGISDCLLNLHCPILTFIEPEDWAEMKELGWVPKQSKDHLEHEPRAGLLLCPNHWASFKANDIFIRFFPDARKFVFVNFCNQRDNQKFHGKAIALDINDRYAPFPALFLLQEIRTRGNHIFKPIAPDMPDDILWQDWIISDGVFDDASGCFKRDDSPDNLSENEASCLRPVVPLGLQFTTTTDTVDELPPGTQRLPPLNEEVITEILAATRASPSWKACQIEGTEWTGTAEENADKYASIMGLQEPEKEHRKRKR